MGEGRAKATAPPLLWGRGPVGHSSHWGQGRNAGLHSPLASVHLPGPTPEPFPVDAEGPSWQVVLIFRCLLPCAWELFLVQGRLPASPSTLHIVRGPAPGSAAGLPQGLRSLSNSESLHTSLVSAPYSFLPFKKQPLLRSHLQNMTHLAQAQESIILSYSQICLTLP